MATSKKVFCCLKLFLRVFLFVLFRACRETLETFSDRDCFGSSGGGSLGSSGTENEGRKPQSRSHQNTRRRETGVAVCGLRGVAVRVCTDCKVMHGGFLLFTASGAAVGGASGRSRRGGTQMSE